MCQVLLQRAEFYRPTTLHVLLYESVLFLRQSTASAPIDFISEAVDD